MRRRHRRHRRHTLRANPPRRHRRRHYRRNPFGGGGRGVMGLVTRAAKCGLFVTAGEGLSVIVPGLVKLPTTGYVGYAARIAAGTALAVFGRRMIGSANAEYLLAGAFSGVYRQLSRQVNIPLFSPALAGYPGPIQLRGYAAPARRMVGAPHGMADGQGRVAHLSSTLF